MEFSNKNTTVNNLKKLSSLHNRIGHARFRRAPVVPLPQLPHTSFASTTTSLPPQTFSTSTNTSLPPPLLHIQPQPPQHQSLTLDFTKPNILISNSESLSLDLDIPKETFSVSSNSSFMSSAITGDIIGDGSVSNGIQSSSLFLTPAIFGGKPPLSSSSSLKNKCHSHSDSGKRSGSNKCHCTKERKNRMKRTVRVAAISDKIADIPSDEYKWRKYGQKLIKGSVYPRGYYKCSTVKGCPARKKVERAKDDPNMMIVTYLEGHCHEIHIENISRSGPMDLVVFEGQH
ncbi:hypothetical protein TSUD_307270 [Trifolium subterraneum]|uniref:WRKY domain-containing protein n=1 Tax=Trifolium subterraneum TaxID=3900 RepID=A0A2Z6PHY6_TRISU|nr:hypothetical protein TSUD_307270 [Trifolium subterraneum]